MWSTAGNATVTANATTSPYGDLSAEKIVQGGAWQWAFRQRTNATSTGSYTFSVWLKTEAATGTMYFDIGDNSCVTSDGTSALSLTQQWKRYSCSSSESATYPNGVFVDFDSHYEMSGATYYAWGAQLVYGNGGPGAYVRTTNSTVSKEGLSVRDNTSESFFLGKLGVGTSTMSTTFSLQGGSSENPLLISSSTGSTLFTILQNGNVGVGTTSPSAKVDIWGNLNVGTSSIPTLFVSSALSRVSIATTSSLYTLTVGNASTSGVVARFQNSSGYCDINPTTTSLTCTSDARLKKNIVTLDASTTLENLNKLHAVTYNWNTEDNASSAHAGFIAQEVQPLFPDLVATDESGLLSVSYSGFIPYLVQAVKTLTEMLGDMKEIFVSKLIKTDRLCVTKTQGGEVCVTGDDIDAFIQSRASGAPQPTENQGTTPATDTGTSTGQTQEGVTTGSTTPSGPQENMIDTPQATTTESVITEPVTPTPTEESTQVTETTQAE